MNHKPILRSLVVPGITVAIVLTNGGPASATAENYGYYPDSLSCMKAGARILGGDQYYCRMIENGVWRLYIEVS